MAAAVSSFERTRQVFDAADRGEAPRATVGTRAGMLEAPRGQAARAGAGSGLENSIESSTDPNLSAIRSSRSEEHTSELQSLMRISYAVFCLKKTTKTKTQHKE